MKELLFDINNYLNDLEKNDEKIHEDYWEMVSYFDDANNLLYKVKKLLEEQQN